MCPTQAAQSLRAGVSRHLHMPPLRSLQGLRCPRPRTDVAGAIRRIAANGMHLSYSASSCRHHSTRCRRVSCSQVNRFPRPKPSCPSRCVRIVFLVLDVHCSRNPLGPLVRCNGAMLIGPATLQAQTERFPRRPHNFLLQPASMQHSQLIGALARLPSSRLARATAITLHARADSEAKVNANANAFPYHTSNPTHQ